MSADIIFWYTGAAIWGIIAACVAGGVLIAAIIGIAQAYHRSRQWASIWRMAYMTDEERTIFFDSARTVGLTDAEWNKVLAMISKHRDRLSKMSKGPIMHLECSEWYELSDGTIGQIVMTSPGVWSRTQNHCEMRTDKDELIEIGADGVLTNNRAIRIVKKLQKPGMMV
jgi:hypothetical protein